MFEHRPLELRAEGRSITGVVMRYGHPATVIAPGGRVVKERFERGAFREYLTEFRTLLNLQHDRSTTVATTGHPGRLGVLAMVDSDTELRMVATLPEGDVFDRVLALVSDGSTAETSVEFRALTERYTGDERIISAATLPGVSMVDAGAYASKIEVRKAVPGAPRRRHFWL